MRILFSQFLAEHQIGKVVNTFAAGLIQVVCTKTGCSHVVLRGENSGAESATELFTCSRLAKSSSLQ